MSGFSRKLQFAVGAQASSSGDLALPKIAWEGGPAYWNQFSKAANSGWSSPNFFPISVFFGKADPTHVASLKDAGINLFMGVEHSPGTFPLSNVTSQGVYAMPNIDEWTPAEVGNDNLAVSWFMSDEIDMDGNYADEYAALAEQQNRVNLAHSYNDGTFLHTNYGNGVLRTFWSVNTMDDHVAIVDSASADKYTYTSPDVADIIDGIHDAPDWPNGVPVQRAYSYGWQADQMRRFQNPASLKPVWTFVETAKPYLIEAGATTIELDQIEGAVWSALIHEARGIAYFQHNNDGRANYSIVDIPTIHAKVKDINTKVLSLAPVLNTQSYYNASRVVNSFTYDFYTFNNGTDAMLKTYNGYAYIFAGLGMHANNPACTSGTVDGTGSKTFTVPAGVTGTTVEVVGEGRNLTVSGGDFTDTFDYEYTHHVYRIAL